MHLLAVALLQATPADGEATRLKPAANSSEPEGFALLAEEELLLFGVEFERLTLTESLTAYGTPTDPLIPLGELARLLDLDLEVWPADRRATGTLGEARRAITIDGRARIARVGGREIQLSNEDVGYSRSDIFIRASILERLLPLRLEVDAEALLIRLTATEKLPIQLQKERIARLRGLSQGAEGTEASLRVKSPYEVFSAPSFDVTLESGRDTRKSEIDRRFDLRLAGDLFYSNFQAFVGSNERGIPAAARLLLERRSTEGGLPFGATRISAGDVYTPALPMGPRSVTGRGISVTTAPLEQTSVFHTTDLRGELPLGYDVELYVNDVLRSGQRTPVDGRYEFLNVPLAGGLNIIRIVSYGPRGERAEAVRILNVDGGRLRKNETTFEFGLVQQNRVIFDLRPAAVREQVLSEVDAPRLVANLTYGLSDDVTLVTGAAIYTTFKDNARQLLAGGLRSSILGLAARLDAAGDQRGGLGMSLGLAGQPLGISAVLRHAEYRGGFLDEAIQLGDQNRSMQRHTALTMDFNLPRIGGKVIPLSARLLRNGYADGGVGIVASGRVSTIIADTLFSTGLDYQRETRPGAKGDNRLTGNIAVSKFLNFKWQLRGAADYDLLPMARMRALSATADRALSEKVAFRLGLGQTFGNEQDTFVQTGATLRLPFGDFALTADHSFREKAWRLNVRYAFGGLFDPSRKMYRITPPGPSNGATALFQAYLDRDGDGLQDADDAPLPRVAVKSPGGSDLVTGEDGRALVLGLGSAATGRLQVSTDDIDSLYVAATPRQVEFEPRPGQVIRIGYPVAPVGEVFARLVLLKPEGPVGLSAVRVHLVKDGADPIAGTTEFDGSVVFSDVPLGNYRLELDPQQAERLGMRLLHPAVVELTSDGAVEAEVVVEFERQ